MTYFFMELVILDRSLMSLTHSLPSVGFLQALSCLCLPIEVFQVCSYKRTVPGILIVLDQFLHYLLDLAFHYHIRPHGYTLEKLADTQESLLMYWSFLFAKPFGCSALPVPSLTGKEEQREKVNTNWMPDYKLSYSTQITERVLIKHRTS